MLLSLGTNQRSQLTRATVFYVAPFKSPLVHFAFLTSVLYFNLLTLCFLWSQQKQTSLLQWDKCHFFFFLPITFHSNQRGACVRALRPDSPFFTDLSHHSYRHVSVLSINCHLTRNLQMFGGKEGCEWKCSEPLSGSCSESFWET